MDCMMDIPMEKIVASMATGEYSFVPADDGLTFFSDYPARAKEGKIAKLVSNCSKILLLLANVYGFTH